MKDLELDGLCISPSMLGISQPTHIHFQPELLQRDVKDVNNSNNPIFNNSSSPAFVFIPVFFILIILLHFI